MKTKVKNIIFLLTALMILLMPCSSFAAKSEPEKEGDFDIEIVSTETDENGYTTAVFSIKNNGKDFSGYARLCMFENYGDAFAVEKLTSISAGESINLSLTFTHPLDFDPVRGVTRFEMRDGSGKRVGYQILQYKDAGMGNVMGILADDTTGLHPLTLNVYLSSLSNYENVSITTEVVKNVTDTDELLGYRYLLIDGYDTESLDKKTIEGIENWVRSGGILLIGTGDTVNTFTGFDKDFIDMDYSTDNNGKPYFFKQSSHQFAMDYYDTVDVTTLLPGDTYSTYVNNCIKSEGNGFIIVADCSLNDPNVSTQDAIEELLNQIGSVYNASGSYSIEMHQDTIEEIFGMMQGKGGINTAILKAIIVLYVVLVGPILYLFLKAMNKREYIWLAVPAVAVFFTVIVFLASRGFAVRHKQFKNISVSAADGSGITDNLFMGFDSGSGGWKVELSEDIKAAGAYSISANGSGSNKREPDFITTYSTNGISNYYNPGGSFEGVMFRGWSENTASGGIEADVSYSGGKMSGTVKNNTGKNFDYVLVVTDNKYTVIEMDSSGTAKVDDYGDEYNSFDEVHFKAQEMYRKKKYKEAGYYAALAFAASEMTSYDSFVIGIGKDSKNLIKGIIDEEDYCCYYSEIK